MFIRKFLIAILGFEKYLRLISWVFIQSYLLKFYLKEHFQVRFLKHLVKQGDVCLDIGANLGYFSVPLSHLVGDKGKVISVEPVQQFRDVLMRNSAYYGKNNVQIIPYALGDQDDKTILMGTPKVDGVIRHGRTEVIEAPREDMVKIHETTMFMPQTLFGGLKKLDFVKCDVEGYEIHIVPLFLEIFALHQPIIEMEIGPKENKEQICGMLHSIGYQAFFLKEGKLNFFDIQNEIHLKEIELYFLTSKHQEPLQNLIAN